MSDVNGLYRAEAALHDVDFDRAGFEWIVADDRDASVIAFLRRARTGPPVLVVCNFTPVPRANYVLGVPAAGHLAGAAEQRCRYVWRKRHGQFRRGVDAAPVAAHGRFHSLNLTLPPLATMFFKPEAH